MKTSQPGHHAEPRTIVIDLKGLRSRQAMFEKVAGVLGFPEHFGHNLDALYDCLTDLKVSKTRPLQIELHGVGNGAAVQSIAAAFDDAAKWFGQQGLTFSVRRT